jgi:hypothetical protein
MLGFFEAVWIESGDLRLPKDSRCLHQRVNTVDVKNLSTMAKTFTGDQTQVAATSSEDLD